MRNSITIRGEHAVFEASDGYEILYPIENIIIHIGESPYGIVGSYRADYLLNLIKKAQPDVFFSKGLQN